MGAGLSDKENNMKCVLCRHGDTRLGKATLTLQRGNAVIIIKEVPADVCDNCGKYYLSESTTRSVLHTAEESAKKGAEVEIVRFVA